MTTLFDSVRDVADDPFGRSKVIPTAQERAMAEVIWAHKGRANPVTVERLAKILATSDRTVKGIKQALIVTHRMRIGATRVKGHAGYFMIADKEDLAATVAAYQGQIIEMWRVLRVLVEARELRQLHGQLTLDEQVGE